MKKTILLILTMITLLISADFKPESYKADMTDMTARQKGITDDSGYRTGILKIYTDQTGISIVSNLGIVETDKTNPGEFWAYLSPGEKWIKITKEGFRPLEYVLEPAIESDMVYILKLKTLGAGSVMGDLNKITFKFNVADVLVQRGNSAPVRSSGKITEIMLSKGDYDYTFIKEGYRNKTKKISVTGDKDINIDLEEGTNQTKIKLPSIVVIESDPQGCEIFLNGQRYGVTPFQGELQPGSYTISLRKTFYYTKEKSFDLQEGATLNLPVVKLKPKFGYYSVKADQQGTKLYLDGALLGENSFSKTKIESGKHIFKAELDMYHTQIREIEFKDGDEKNIEFKMKPNFGKLIINSEPEGALLYLNGSQVGTTPYKLERARSGNYVVKLTKQLWSDYEDQIEVFDEKTTDKTFPLNKNFGTLIIKAEGSDIYIDGNNRGKGRFQGNMKPGKYQVTAKKLKHKDHSKEVFVNIGREQEVLLEPDPIRGTVSIYSEPFETKGADIYLNGSKRDEKTPAVIPLLIGDYELKLKLSGYLDSEERFTLAEGENKTLRLTMMTYEGSQNEKRDFWAKQKWYALGAFALSAGAGGYFYNSGNTYFDDYESCTSTTKEAEDLYDKAVSADKMRDVSFSVSLAPLGYFFYSWYKQSSYQ